VLDSDAEIETARSFRFGEDPVDVPPKVDQRDERDFPLSKRQLEDGGAILLEHWSQVRTQRLGIRA
jgi:hypothetical protein